ncbi:MAG: NUDIX domain-containing protein [Reyranella sp.]
MVVIARPWRLEGVAGLIFTSDARYLMQLRDDNPQIHMPNNWALFGGHVETGEDDAEALRRELMEELGLRARTIRPFLETAYEIPGTGFGPIRKAFFEVPFDASEMISLVLREGQQMRLLTYAEIRAMSNVVPWDEFAVHAHARRAEVARLPRQG